MSLQYTNAGWCSSVLLACIFSPKLKTVLAFQPCLMKHYSVPSRPFSKWDKVPGGYLVQKTLQGCAANMGSTISLLVYEWPLIKCKIWYMNGSIFSKFGQIWAKIGSKFKKILDKIGNFVQNLEQNWADWYMNGLLFLEKLVFVWVYFQILWRHIPTKTKLEYPPGIKFSHSNNKQVGSKPPWWTWKGI